MSSEGGSPGVRIPMGSIEPEPTTLPPIEIEVREFQLSQMVPNPSILIIAKRGSGKSYVTRELVHHFRDIPCGAVISPTDLMNKTYGYFFPDLYIHHKLNDELVKRIIARHRSIRETHERDTTDPRSLLVMDDCLLMSSLDDKKSVREVLFNGRHYEMTYIATINSPTGLSPDLRANFDYVFIMADSNPSSRRKLWQNYCSMFGKFDEFEDVFDECTKDYRSMVIDNCDPTGSKVFRFKAAEHKFTFGSKEFLEIHKELYDPDWMHKMSGQMERGEPRTIPEDTNFSCFINRDKVKEVNDIKGEKLIDMGSDTESIDDFLSEIDDDPKEYLQMSYKDDTYNINVNITDLQNHEVIKILCEHIEYLKSKSNSNERG